MSTPQQNTPLQFAHAVFAGGGVRGIAHVGALEIAEQLGYRWDYVAGTSAGAIIAALVAAGYTAKDLHSIMQGIDYSRFAPCPEYDLLHVSEVSNILTYGGLHNSSYIEEFVREKLQAKCIRTFGDLLVVGQEQNLNLFQRYKLTVIASDITQGRILRLPQDAHLYGIDPDALDVARAVRMSASIPFFFVPMQLTDANGINSCIVDGGMLSNFPLFLFEHARGERDTTPIIPTFGFQLVDTLQQYTSGNDSNISAPRGLAMLKALFSTMLSAHDRLYMNDETFARTIAIPTHGIASTQFNLTQEQEQQLYESGKAAATTFFKTWDFEAYKVAYRCDNPLTTPRLAYIHQTMQQYAHTNTTTSGCNVRA